MASAVGPGPRRRFCTSRPLMFLVIATRLRPAPAVVHVAPAAPLPAALVEKEPATVPALAYPNSRRPGRAKQRERFACEQPADLPGRMRRGWTPMGPVIVEGDFRPRSTGGLANGVQLPFRCFAYSGDGQSCSIDSFTKQDDLVERFGMPDQFEIGPRSDQADLSCPSQKRLPVRQHFNGLCRKVFTGCIAEIERQVAADLVRNQSAWDENPGSAARGSASSRRSCSFRIDCLCHKPLYYHLSG